MTVLIVDLSHHQAEPDWAALAAGEISAVILKATEGVDYVDPTFAPRRQAAYAHGLLVGAYHFARCGDVHAEARHFLTTVGQLQHGDTLHLDMEVPGADIVSWSGTWLDDVHAATGLEPMLYLNSSELAGCDWRPVVARNAGLWLAKYDGSQTPVGSGAWPMLALKQFTSSGNVPGLAGPVDEDVFFGTIEQLTAYGYQGAAPAPAPQPVPAPAPAPSGVAATFRCQQGQTSAAIAHLQRFLRENFPAYAGNLPSTGFYGPMTVAAVREFAHRSGIASADGTNVGPLIAVALERAGFGG